MGPILLKKAFPHLIAIVIFILLNVVYFYPQFEGKVISQGDMVSSAGMTKEIKDYKKDSSDDIFWTNSMFGGMPSYQIWGVSSQEVLGNLNSLFRLFFPAPAGLFILFMTCTYIAFLAYGVSPWLAIIGAVLFGFTSNNFILWEAGHITKLYTLAYSSLVLAGFNLVVFRKNYLLGLVIFATGLGLNVRSYHIQMTYYLMIVMIILYLSVLVDAIRKKYLPDLVRGSLVLLLGVFLAVGSNATNIWKNYSYAEDTMRGKPILKSVANTEANSSSETEGLAWDYAMQWSNSWMDVFATVIPGVVGGGSREKVSTESAIYKDLKGKGANLGNNFKAPLYWGQLPFTSGPTYFGAVVFLLFLLGAQLVKTPLKWWLLLSVLLTFLLSLGKNFSILNEFLFNYLPLYSKFRAPSSILGITALLTAIMAVLGLSEVVQAKNRETLLRPLLIATGLASTFCLFFLILGGSVFEFASAGDARLQSSGYSIGAIISDRKSLMQRDSLRTLFFVLATAGLIYLYIKDKLKMPLLILGIGLLALIDLWTIGKRYLSSEDFVKPATIQTQNFNARQADQQIFSAENINITKKGLDGVIIPTTNGLGRGGYRVLDLSINTFNSANTSYFHNTIGGYHAAKLQRYQDLIENHINKNNSKVLNMLNTKYVISREQQVQNNPGALGTVWFVDNIIKAKTPNEELATLSSFDPSKDAVVLDSEFNNYIGNFNPTKQGTIKQDSYHPNRLIYTSNSTSEQLAVFSEIWYGPDKGWKVHIDGTEVPHVRANYVLRALRIPAGNHQIEFFFEPDTYYKVANVSYFSSLLLLLLLFLVIIYSIYNYLKNTDFKEMEKVMVKKELIKTESRKGIKKKAGKKGKNKR